MLFNVKECGLIESALETYDDADRHVFRSKELQHEYVTAALSKLHNISPMINFTKKDFTVMALAVRHAINTLDSVGAEMRMIDDLWSVFDKLVELAGPVKKS